MRPIADALTSQRGERSDLAHRTVTTFLLLFAVVPLLLFSDQSIASMAGLQFVARVAIIGYAAWNLSVLVARAEPRWFATFFWAFCYVWMGLAGMAQALAGHDPFTIVVRHDTDTFSALIVLFGMGAWHVTYAVVNRRSMLHRPSPAQIHVVSERAVMVVTLVAAVLTPLLLLRQGGWDAYLTTRQERQEALVAAGLLSDGSLAQSGLTIGATRAPPLAALLGIIVILQQRPELRRLPRWWILTGIALVLNLLVNNPLGSSRFWFATAFLGSLLCLRIFQQQRGYRAFLLSLLMALTVLFPYADYFRTDDAQVQRQGVASFMVNKLDYDAPAQVTHGIERYSEYGPQNGLQLVSAVGFAVPRSIWTGKGEPSGTLIARSTGFHFENLSAPLWAEGFIDFGPVGSLIYLALAGLIAGLVDRAYLAALRNPRATALRILCPPLAVYSMILIRGSLLGTIADGAFLAFVLVLLIRRPRSDTDTDIVPKPAIDVSR